MRPTFQASTETTRLVSFFKTLPQKKTVSWYEASKTAGFEINSSSAVYNSARKIAERDHGIVIETMRKFGFFRSDGADMEKSGDRFMGRMRRGAKRASNRMVLAIEHNLDPEQARRADEKLSRFRIIYSNAEPASSNRPKRGTPEEAPKSDRFGDLRRIK